MDDGPDSNGKVAAAKKKWCIASAGAKSAEDDYDDDDDDQDVAVTSRPRPRRSAKKMVVYFTKSDSETESDEDCKKGSAKKKAKRMSIDSNSDSDEDEDSTSETEFDVDSSDDERLFMINTNGATIYVLVVVSYHAIAGARIHNQSTRINNILGLIKDLKLMRTLKVIDDETHDREHGIFTRCAIECEGLEGTVESAVGSVNFASLFATCLDADEERKRGGLAGRKIFKWA
jgi:hypothetical protein